MDQSEVRLVYSVIFVQFHLMRVEAFRVLYIVFLSLCPVVKM